MLWLRMYYNLSAIHRHTHTLIPNAFSFAFSPCHIVFLSSFLFLWHWISFVFFYYRSIYTPSLGLSLPHSSCVPGILKDIEPYLQTLSCMACLKCFNVCDYINWAGLIHALDFDKVYWLYSMAYRIYSPISLFRYKSKCSFLRKKRPKSTARI